MRLDPKKLSQDGVSGLAEYGFWIPAGQAVINADSELPALSVAFNSLPRNLLCDSLGFSCPSGLAQLDACTDAALEFGRALALLSGC